MRSIRNVLTAVLLMSSVTGCDRSSRVDELSGLDEAAASITADEILDYVKELSDDKYEGRMPASEAGEAAADYVMNQFESVGLSPGNQGSWFQEVPLVEITADPSMNLAVAGGAETLEFEYRDRFMAWTKRVVENVSIDASEMIFVGYGIVAPEYGWNDYDGVDVTGKTVVMLVNDPGFATQDSTLFRGNTMTYYGRWTYKYEEAARQGAEAAFIVHDTAPAGYPWLVVSGSWSGPQASLVAEDNNLSSVAVEGWFRNDAAREIFQSAGMDFDALSAAAEAPDFEASPMGLTASIAISNKTRRSTSRNVIGLLEGTTRKDEYIIYTAHWDHLGKDDRPGDNIFNGARDNSLGVAGMLEIAEAFSSLPVRPPRSIVFLAVTAEEQGLLGSAYYASNPVFPLNKTVASINKDGGNIWGQMNDVTVVGYGNSELDEYLDEAAALQGRRLRPDPEPEKGFFFRSDHFSFAKQGVPSLYVNAGIDHVQHGPEWSLEKRAEWTTSKYHKPGDEYEESWDVSGEVLDVRLLFAVGAAIATDTHYPAWNDGSAFKAVREANLSDK